MFTKEEMKRLKDIGVKFIDGEPTMGGFPVDDDTLGELLSKNYRNKQKQKRKRHNRKFEVEDFYD